MRRIVNIFPIYFYVKLWTPFSGPSFSPEVTVFKQFRIHFVDAFIVKSQIVALKFLRKFLNITPIYFYVKL